MFVNKVKRLSFMKRFTDTIFTLQVMSINKNRELDVLLTVFFSDLFWNTN